MTNFDVKISEDDRRFYLSITRNPKQWTTLTFYNVEELQEAANAIHGFLQDRALNAIRELQEKEN